MPAYWTKQLHDLPQIALGRKLASCYLCRESDATYVSLGLLTNRGLAYEGLYMWKEALKEYDEVRAKNNPAPFKQMVGLPRKHRVRKECCY